MDLEQFLPKDEEIVAMLNLENDLATEAHVLWIFFNTTMNFLAALQMMDRPVAAELHRELRRQAGMIITGEAFEQ